MAKKKTRGEATSIITSRDLEIIRLIYSEFTSAQIADKLGINRRTLEGCRLRLSIKTNTKGVVGLIKYALKNGIVKLDK